MRKRIVLLLSLLMVLMMSAVTFAADLETAVTADDALQEVAEVNTEKVSFDRNSGSVEIVITAEGIDGDGNFCIKTPRTNMTLSGGIIEDCNMKSDSKKLPSIAVYGYAKKNSWKGSTLEIGIGCEATGKIKTYKGTCTVYKADGITKIASKTFLMTNNSGTKYMVRQYFFGMGKSKSCKVKLSNLTVIDIYGRSSSMTPIWTGVFRK